MILPIIIKQQQQQLQPSIPLHTVNQLYQISAKLVV